MVRVDAEGAKPDDAEFFVADGDWVGGSPLSVQLLTGAKKVNFGLERRGKQLVPILQIGQQGQGFGVQGLKTWPKHVGQLPLVHQ